MHESRPWPAILAAHLPTAYSRPSDDACRGPTLLASADLSQAFSSFLSHRCPLKGQGGNPIHEDELDGRKDWLTERFQEQRTQLRAVAYRMLGSLAEADDAVQDAWVRVSLAETNDIENFGGWLTTIVARVCLNMLRSRKSGGGTLEVHLPDPVISPGGAMGTGRRVTPRRLGRPGSPGRTGRCNRRAPGLRPP